MSFLLVLICTAFLIAGCAGTQNNAGTNSDINKDATTPKTTDTTAPTTPDTTPPPAELPKTPEPSTTFSVENCNLLEPKDFEAIFGDSFKEASNFAYPGGTCSRGWGDAELFRSGRGTSVSLNLNKIGETTAVKSDLDMSCLESFTVGTTVIKNPVGMENIEAVSNLGSYLACWFKEPYNAVNFGVGKYKFQLQCTGGACTKDKAVEIAKIVVSRVSV